MSCLHKYWLKEFIKFFSIIQSLIIVLFVCIDYLSRMDKFLNSDLSLFGGLEYVLLKVPFMFVQLTPASILLATIIVFALMNRNNELLAIRSSGISIYFLVKPAIIVALFFSVLIFFLGETIIPISMAKANYIRYHVMTKQHNIYASKENIWVKSNNQMVHINFYDPRNQSVSGITITSLTSDFSIGNRIDAQKGFFKDGQWVFKNIIEQTHTNDSEEDAVKIYDAKTIPLTFEPADLGAVVKKSEEMSFFQLRKYVQKVKDEGYDATVYKVDLYGKIAFPFICVIMVLAGAATGMRPFAKQNIPIAVAIGVVIAFMYWSMHGFCLSLGYGSVLPPVISAWTANLFFLCFGVLYLVNTE